MFKERSLIGLAALLGLIATQACSSDAASDDGALAGAAGVASSAGASSGAGTTSTAQGGGGASASGGTGGTATGGSTTSGGGSTSTAGGTGGTPAGGTAGAGGSGGAGGATPNTFTEQTTTKGMVVATAKGITLYVYQPDTPATGGTPAVSACTNNGSTCLTHWPLYYGNPVSVPAGLSAADFGSFDRGGGVLQSTYKGWPVYNYDDDKAPGDAKGDLEKQNNKVVWYAVRIPFTAPTKP